jgi:protein O-mannosyl-transferase
MNAMTKKIIALAFLLAVTAGVYYNSLRLPFIFDDINKIVDNPDIKQLSNLKTRLIYPYDRDYHIPHRNDPSRPLVYLTFTLNHYFGRLDPFGYHLFNVALHMLNALLVFFLARKIVLLALNRETVLFPLAVSLLFAVHTVNSSVVAYVYSRSDILASFFYLLSLLLFFGGRGTFALSAFCFILALSSKQSSVTLPAVTLIFDYLFPGGFSFRGVRERKYRHLFFWLILCAYLLIRYAYFGALGDLEGLDALWNRYDYLLIQPYVVLRYLQFLIMPVGLCYYHYLGPGAVPALRLASLVAATAGIIFLAYKLHSVKTGSSKILLFSLLWFVIQLLPTSSFFPTTTAMVENRLYLAGIGFYLGTAFLLYSLLRAGVSADGKRRLIAALLAGIYILSLCVMTVKRNRFYGDPIGLWEEAVRRYPDNARAYNNLGNLYCDKEKYDEAIKEYMNALAIKPDYAEAYNNLGIIYSIRKEYDKAISTYETALKYDPDIAETHTNLGNLYSLTKKYDKAVAEYQKALSIDPNLAGAYYNIGILYNKQKKRADALRAFRAAFKIYPYYEDTEKRIKELE